MPIRNAPLLSGIVPALLFPVFLLLCCDSEKERQQAAHQNRPPRITPDYQGTVLPPNIAPCNFEILESGVQYRVELSAPQGPPIVLTSGKADVIIPEKEWHQLLESNRGSQLMIDVYVKNSQNNWQQYQTLTNAIAKEDIDAYVVYRKIHPSHNTWRKMGLYQRNLTNFDVTPVLKNDNYKWGCAHCHTFNKNKTAQMTIGIRSGDYQSSQLIVDTRREKAVYKLPKKFGFTAWHPSGNMLVCCANDPPLVLHTSKNEMRDIVDVDSWMGYYIPGSDTIKTIPQLSRKDWLENYPAWSPDGKYLYFCNTRKLWDKVETLPPKHFDQSKYSLYRIAYDIHSDQWGEAEPILLSETTGLSLNQPRVSPDGRWITFSLCEYSCWPSYHPDSDLYILDLKKTEETGKAHYQKMAISSPECESWHSWSSNSKWIIFSSKMNNPLFNRTYITYIQKDGSQSKALLLPQKNPTSYKGDLNTYTIPELISEPVQHRGETLARVIREQSTMTLGMPITGASPGIQN